MATKQKGPQSSGQLITPFRLLDLPPELWSRIVRSSWSREEVRLRLKQPAISRTSRILREETLSAFYTDSYGWYVTRDTTTLLIDWLGAVPERYRVSLDVVVTLIGRELRQDLGIALIGIGYVLEDIDACKHALAMKCRVVAIAQLGEVR
ncbi:hypothetical protein LTR56_024642 [Elasticomyces elasticus]|nr:hypothetical protein LTR56_024642 [Elasticomyces elasticus]KAK3622232.1 hypothetical protein LTR22_024892 [Elasticomyces elasticus]KAK4919764.1 hypothetical protein LTR49_012667 [Elasticomyces elasticus]KAK5758414.1 hypothetical protein LTS12_011436 [Elasticomyces elasticus]